MDDATRFREILEGYLDLGSQLLTNWAPFLDGVSLRVDAGTYDAKDVVDDFPTMTKLVAESWMLAGSEAIDALAILTKDFSEKETITGYGTDPSKAGTTRTLALKGDLKSVSGEQLPAARVALVPPKLDPKATAFDLEFDGNGFKARTYDGYVVATDENGGKEEIFVSVTIG